MTVNRAQTILNAMVKDHKNGQDVYKKALASLRRRYPKGTKPLIFDFLADAYAKHPELRIAFASAVRIFIKDKGKSCFFCSLHLVNWFFDDPDLTKLYEGRRWVGCCKKNYLPEKTTR